VAVVAEIPRGGVESDEQRPVHHRGQVGAEV
jgi:hypothetical protein